MSITLKKLIAASIALLVTAAMQAITIPEGVTVYRGAATAGTAVSALTDGHKYLIYDPFNQTNNQRYAFRYVDAAGGTVKGNHTLASAASNLSPAYVWTATSVGDNQFTFKNELYGQYLSMEGSTQFSDNAVTIADTPTTFTISTASADDNTFYVCNQNSVYWDGAWYNMVGWSGTAASSHPYQFYEVGEENGVDYCYYSSKTFVNGEEVHSTDKTLTKASEISSPVTTEKGITITSSVADDGSLALTGELKGIDPITVTIKNKQGGVYVTATATGLTCASATNTDDANKLALYPTTDDQRTFYIYSPSQKMFVTTIGYNTGTAVGLGDAPDAKLLVLGVESDHTETICDAANTGSFYYWNWRSNNVGTWQNSSSAVGSHWYTILSDETFAANTAEGVVDAFDAAIVNAQTTVETLQAFNIDASELQAIITEAQAALIGRNSFTDLTTRLNNKSEEMLQANIKAAITAELNTANGIYIAHNTPGYLPVSTAENVALKEKIDAAQSAIESGTTEQQQTAYTELKAAEDAMTAKIAGLSGSETTFYTGSLYRINNPESDRGYIYYNSANDTYPWATSKTAYSGNSDDDAMLFGFIKHGDNYYCYNVGSGRFLGIGTGTFSAQSPNKTWTWEVIEPAAITLTSSVRNSYPYLEISSSDVHMSISKSYVGPIISYYETTDAGVPMLFEYVREATDEETAKIEKLFETDGQVEYFENAFAAMAENVNSSAANDGENTDETAGNENQLGCYSESTISAAKEALSAAIKAEGATSASVKAVYDNYVGQWNQPEVDAVYTIASYHSTGETYRYLYNNNGTLAVSTNEDEYGKLNYKYWKWSKIPVVTATDNSTASSAPAAADVDADEETDGTSETEDNATYTYGFTNTIDDTTIYLAAKNNNGQDVTISLDANVAGCVNLYDTTRYVMVMNSTNAIDCSTNATLDNASGQFVVTKVNDASSVTTAIREVTAEADAGAGAIYDLQGRRVSAPTHTGLYIVGGKTTLIRK
jgi:hypothetical protein